MVVGPSVVVVVVGPSVVVEVVVGPEVVVEVVVGPEVVVEVVEVVVGPIVQANSVNKLLAVFVFPVEDVARPAKICAEYAESTTTYPPLTYGILLGGVGYNCVLEFLI